MWLFHHSFYMWLWGLSDQACKGGCGWISRLRQHLKLALVSNLMQLQGKLTPLNYYLVFGYKAEVKEKKASFLPLSVKTWSKGCLFCGGAQREEEKRKEFRGANPLSLLRVHGQGWRPDMD
ncbi:hypothetical protein AVEN_262396-1 [Araneus ventricosus]|uniref:Uncharacterized protein n=1 Tax=Araneus ventricosus TaxID=182803 RepID=A0A4Y2R0D4_ARAVE|nr:hypothetical protein AVEN_262396-1 [Araneus ventricosus]